MLYGDLGMSPLYVFADVNKAPIDSDDDVLGALSLVIYTIDLIPLVKYVLIVLKANDNGEGGTFALYLLICRYANVNLRPNCQSSDEHISSFRLKHHTPEMTRAFTIKVVLERKSTLKTLLLLPVLLGTSMIFRDGILTPTLLVMFAISGLQGEINICQKWQWSALVGCVLCVTGSEALFADLGHFSVRLIQITFTCIVFLFLLLASMVQAAIAEESHCLFKSIL